MANALARHAVDEALFSLLPQNAEYIRLKAQLAATPARDKATVERLRANLERWRWMPRNLGRRYIIVNVPAFELILVEDDKIIARHRVIVGKKSTPTPQFGAMVTGVILNPWWDVPQSIIAESVGRLVRTNPAGARAKGYVTSRSSGGRLSVRQTPGPNNALGHMKLEMANPFTVYIHDTPSKPLFDEDVRAFSHGCIRADGALDFAATLLVSQSGWDRAAIDRIVQTRSTTKINLQQSIPVFVGYFTASVDQYGEVASYPDIYGRDGPVVAALVDRQLGAEAYAPSP
jgi:murein L,D-transpeptidase YcbB/YkuD